MNKMNLGKTVTRNASFTLLTVTLLLACSCSGVAEKKDSAAAQRDGAPPTPATLEEMERAHILSVLEACGWKVAGKGNAADRLGLKRGTLRARMKRLGIERP